MAEEQALLQRCYRRMRAELGDAELRPRRCHHAARHRYPEGRAGEGVPGSAVTIMKERYRTAL